MLRAMLTLSKGQPPPPDYRRHHITAFALESIWVCGLQKLPTSAFKSSPSKTDPNINFNSGQAERKTHCSKVILVNTSSFKNIFWPFLGLPRRFSNQHEITDVLRIFQPCSTSISWQLDQLLLNQVPTISQERNSTFHLNCVTVGLWLELWTGLVDAPCCFQCQWGLRITCQQQHVSQSRLHVSTRDVRSLVLSCNVS